MSAAIRELRQARMLTGLELAKRAGLSRSHVFSIENQNYAPSLATLERICAGLETGLGRILSVSQDEVLLENAFIRACVPLVRQLNTNQRSLVIKTLEAAPKTKRVSSGFPDEKSQNRRTIR